MGSCSPPPSPLAAVPPPAAPPPPADTEAPAPLAPPVPPGSPPGAAPHAGLTLAGLMGLPLPPLPPLAAADALELAQVSARGGEGGEAELDPGVAELLGSGEERSAALRTSQRFYLRLVQWLGRKRRPGRTPKSAEHHAKVHYGLRTDVAPHDPKTARKRFADLLRRAARGGSWEEGRTLLAQQESGYSSPNISAQHTPTAHHRLVNPPGYMRRSLELSPQRAPSTRPRMSLPADHLRRTLDGRFSVQAAERRRRLSRGKTISQDEGFPPAPPAAAASTPQDGGGARPNTPLAPSARRMSRPGSSSREESTGEESGFEEEEPVEVRVPPRVLEERRDSGASTTQVTGGHDPLAEWAIQWDQLRFGHVLRRGSTTNIYR